MATLTKKTKQQNTIGDDTFIEDFLRGKYPEKKNKLIGPSSEKKTDDLTLSEFKARVEEYFLMVESINKERKVDGGVHTPVTPPGLAQHLVWSVEKLVNYPNDGIFAPVVEYAMVRCENFLLASIFNRTIDKALGSLMLKTYFGYSEREGVQKKPNRSISDVLDEIEKNG